MPKKCIICDKEAVYAIKGCSEYYCEWCAIENFGDISCLNKINEGECKLIEDKIDKK